MSVSVQIEPMLSPLYDLRHVNSCHGQVWQRNQDILQLTICKV